MLKTTPTLTVVVNGKVYSTKRLWECVVPALKNEVGRENWTPYLV
jgi:hypothetical protein